MLHLLFDSAFDGYFPYMFAYMTELINFAVTITKQFTIRIIPLCKHLERVFGLAFLFYGGKKNPRIRVWRDTGDGNIIM